MKIAWIADEHDPPGGAELTQQEFRAAAPDEVEFTEPAECEAAVVFNCVTFGPDLIPHLRGKRVIRYFSDVDPHSNPELRDFLLANSTLIFCSELHQRKFPHAIPDWAVTKVIPPALDLDRFKPTRQVKRNGHRSGACAIGSWANPGKGQQNLLEWSDKHGPVDVYGEGAFVPHGPNLEPKGPLPYHEVPQTLWRYERAVHLPTAIEPFGRAVLEASEAGCALVVNRNVGALEYIEKRSEALRTASDDFWRVVLGL